MTSRAETLLREAAKYLASAEQKQSKADADKWAAAERMWKANEEEGATQREIAQAVGLSKDTVSRYVRIQHKRIAGDTRAFAELYYEIQGHTPTDREDQAVERVLRERPHVVAEKIAAQPQAAKAIAGHKPARMALSRATDEHYADVKAESDAKFAEAVGQDVADGLAEEQRLRDAEGKVFEARRALRDALALLNEADLDAMRDSWREDFLKTLDDLAMRVDVARSLLSGTLEADLDRFLAEV